jgi:hypothetical protein
MGLFDYIEVFYNQRRRHWTIGQVSPAAFEKARATQAAQTNRLRVRDKPSVANANASVLSAPTKSNTADELRHASNA